MTKTTSKRYSPEVRERAVRMVREHRGEHASQWEAISSIAGKIGCSGETLRKWVFAVGLALWSGTPLLSVYLRDTRAPSNQAVSTVARAWVPLLEGTRPSRRAEPIA